MRFKFDKIKWFTKSITAHHYDFFLFLAIDVIKCLVTLFFPFWGPKCLGQGVLKRIYLLSVCPKRYASFARMDSSHARRDCVICPTYRYHSPWAARVVEQWHNRNPFCLLIKFLQANDVSRFGQATYVYSLAWKVHHRPGEVWHGCLFQGPGEQ